mgnify:CR=1 FL=1
MKTRLLIAFFVLGIIVILGYVKSAEASDLELGLSQTALDFDQSYNTSDPRDKLKALDGLNVGYNNFRLSYTAGDIWLGQW